MSPKPKINDGGFPDSGMFSLGVVATGQNSILQTISFPTFSAAVFCWLNYSSFAAIFMFLALGHIRAELSQSGSFSFKGNMHVANRGFTLVELLTAIAIIVVLMSLLFPAVSRIRGEGESVKCTGNMKQLATSLLNFQADTGHLPDVNPGWDLDALSYISRADANGAPEYSNILHCPSDKMSRLNPRSYSYSPVLLNYNNQYSWAGGGAPNSGLKMINIPKHTETVMLMELHNILNIYKSANWLVSGGVQDVHHGWMNAAFCDGSVRRMSVALDGPYFFDKHIVIQR